MIITRGDINMNKGLILWIRECLTEGGWKWENVSYSANKSIFFPLCFFFSFYKDFLKINNGDFKLITVC